MTDDAKTARDNQVAKMQADAEKTNSERKGVGTRIRVGLTRGKGSMPISWEAFDETKPETLPKTLKEFSENTGIKSESEILGYVISGFNTAKYSEASDPIGEFINDAWKDDVKASFRIVVRQSAKMFNKTIEEVAENMRQQLDANPGSFPEKATP